MQKAIIVVALIAAIIAAVLLLPEGEKTEGGPPEVAFLLDADNTLGFVGLESPEKIIAAADEMVQGAREAMGELLSEVRERRVAIMCSESVWWRCHRRVVADVAVLAHGVTVRHLMHDGRLTEHHPAEGARLRPDGTVVWDG